MSASDREPHVGRPAEPSAASADASPAEAAGDTLLFVDAVEGDRARLLWGVEAFDVPVGLLPVEAREGAWLRATFIPAPAPPDEGAALRKKLGAADDGGDIDL